MTAHPQNEVLQYLGTSRVTRVEVIDENGRSYSNHNAKEVYVSLQDDGRTLKIFTHYGDYK